jgi:hypothetical protein
MRAIRFLRTLAATLALCTSVAVQASPVTVIELFGSVGDYGYDTTGVFGSPATSLIGASFKAHFAFDLSLGSRATGPNSDELLGGPSVGLSMPLLAASIWVNGVQADYPLNGWAYLLTQNGSEQGNDLMLRVEFYEPPLRSDWFVFVGSSPDIVNSLNAAYSLNTVYALTQFQIRSDDPLQSGFLRFAEAHVNIDSLTVSTSDVTEPSSISLMALSVLALLAIGRSKRVRSRND